MKRIYSLSLRQRERRGGALWFACGKGRKSCRVWLGVRSEKDDEKEHPEELRFVAGQLVLSAVEKKMMKEEEMRKRKIAGDATLFFEAVRSMFKGERRQRDREHLNA